MQKGVASQEGFHCTSIVTDRVSDGGLGGDRQVGAGRLGQLGVTGRCLRVQTRLTHQKLDLRRIPEVTDWVTTGYVPSCLVTAPSNKHIYM